MTKEKLRELFETYKGEILSGEKIAEELGLSRTAVWKAINSLREEGYDIESIKKKGYYLNTCSDILSLIKLKQHLNVPIPMEQIYLYKQIASTNTQALLDGLNGAKDWTIIAAEEQTQGIAKNNKVFQSPKGKGVYLSILLKPMCTKKELVYLSQCIEQALLTSLNQLTHLEFEMNENHEVVYKNKKVCGVMIQELIEEYSQCVQQLVVGIGLNVYGEEDYFGVESEENLSLYGVTNAYYNRSELIGTFLNCFYTEYHNKIMKK